MTELDVMNMNALAEILISELCECYKTPQSIMHWVKVSSIAKTISIGAEKIVEKMTTTEVNINGNDKERKTEK